MEKNTGASSNSPQQQPNPERKVKRGVRRLRRTENCVQWGFRVEGGADCKEPLHIIKVTPRSLAEKSGLQAGDVIIKIGKVVTKDLTHDSAKMEILRAGNELDLVLERDFSKVKSKPVTVERKPVPAPAETPEESNRAYTNPNVQSRSFLILQENLEPERLDIYPPQQLTAETIGFQTRCISCQTNGAEKQSNSDWRLTAIIH